MLCKQIVFSLNIYYGYFCKIHVLKKKKKKKIAVLGWGDKNFVARICSNVSGR